VTHWVERIEAREAFDAARAEVDAVLWDRRVRAAAVEVAASSRERGARDSAVIEGADLAFDDDSPMGRVVAAAHAVTDAVTGQLPTWSRAPLQVLAHLHTLVVASLGAGDPGRPRTDDAAEDPLGIGGVPPSATVGPRLQDLSRVIARGEQLPALAVAAIVHGEAMHLRPFASGSGLLARACIRLVMADRGVDPSLFTVPELGIQEQGRPAYVSAIRDYASGDPERGVAYARWFATSIALGAQATTAGVPGQS
jgi:hypothetical protein